MVSECFNLTFKNLPSPDKGLFLIEKRKCKKNNRSRRAKKNIPEINFFWRKTKIGVFLVLFDP